MRFCSLREISLTPLIQVSTSKTLTHLCKVWGLNWYGVFIRSELRFDHHQDFSNYGVIIIFVELHNLLVYHDSNFLGIKEHPPVFCCRIKHFVTTLSSVLPHA